MGLHTPENLEESVLSVEEETVLELLQSKSDLDILALPLLKTTSQTAVHRAIAAIVTLAYQTNPSLRRFLTAKLVHLSLVQGNSVHSVHGYVLFGATLERTPTMVAISNRVAGLAMSLMEQLGERASVVRAYLYIYALIYPWSTHLREIVDCIQNSIRSGKDLGEVEWVGRLMCFYTTYGSLDGRDLRVLDRQISIDNQFIARHKSPVLHKWNQMFRQYSLNLLGKSRSRHLLTGEGYDETRSLQEEVERNDRNILYIIYMHKMMLSYLFGRYHEAAVNAEKAELYLDGIPGMILMAYQPIYQSLALLAIYPDQSEDEQLRILDKVASNQEKIKDWAEHAPMNFLHKYYLVEAEKARVLEQHQQAVEYYDKAIDLAREHRYINEEALANERAACFYENQNRPRFAEVYMREAYRLYDQWGAKAKTDHLSQKYPQWFMEVENTTPQTPPLDIDTLVRATQTFTSTPLASDMLQNLMKVVMENAGAQRSVLLLQTHGQWTMEAEATLDPANIQVLQSLPINTTGTKPVLAQSVVQYAIRTKQNVLLDHACEDPVFRNDPYIQHQKSQSLLCLPIMYQGSVLALLYLENNLIKGAFTTQRIHTLNLLASQIAISLHNTLQYEEQLQIIQYLYRLRSALENAQTTDQIISRTGELLLKSLKNYPQIGIDICADNQQWQHNITPETDCLQYSQDIAWANQKRGQLSIYSHAELEQAAQNVFVTETAAQISHTLEARELQLQLLQSARLVSLGQMAAGVAHELNQPLGGISATAEDYYLRLEEGMAVSEDQIKASFKRILNMVERMSHTVEHLRVFSRNTAHEPGQSIDINNIIHNSLDLIGTQIRNHGITIALDLSEELPQVIGHPYQLEQVFLNLLGNARDALNAKTVDIGITKQITIRTYQEHDHIIAEVEDNGTGISSEHLNRIFEPFFTTKRAEEGTGLGLSITYAIVKNHGGDITCQSSNGEGTTFRVTFPIAT